MNLLKDLAPGEIARFPNLFAGSHQVAGVGFNRQVWVTGYTDQQDGPNVVPVTFTAVQGGSGVPWQVDLRLGPSSYGGGTQVAVTGAFALVAQNKGAQRCTVSVLTEET